MRYSSSFFNYCLGFGGWKYGIQLSNIMPSTLMKNANNIVKSLTSHKIDNKTIISKYKFLK